MMESSNIVRGEKGQTDWILEDLIGRMAEVSTRSQKTILRTDSSMAHIGIRLDDLTYAMLSPVVEMYIPSWVKLKYSNEEIPQPSLTDPTYQQWWAEDLTIQGWLINNMDQFLINNFICFPKAKVVWDAVATIYFDGTNTSQLYNLQRKVTKTRQVEGRLRSISTAFKTCKEKLIFIDQIQWSVLLILAGATLS